MFCVDYCRVGIVRYLQTIIKYADTKDGSLGSVTTHATKSFSKNITMINDPIIWAVTDTEVSTADSSSSGCLCC